MSLYTLWKVGKIGQPYQQLVQTNNAQSALEAAYDRGPGRYRVTGEDGELLLFEICPESYLAPVVLRAPERVLH